MKNGESIKERAEEQCDSFIFKTIGTITLPRRIEWPLILDWLRPQKNERILDVACGQGQLTLKIGLTGSNAYGVDSSATQIRRARRLAERQGIDCTFSVADAQQLPYSDESFDKLVCSSSLEHFKNDLEALCEMNRLLRPNGSLILTVDSFTYPVDDAWKAEHKKKWHVENYYDERKLRARFAESGFEMVRSKYLLHSRAATFFLKTHMACHNFFLTVANCVVAHPVILVFDRLTNNGDAGYTLLAEGKKVHVPQ